MPGSACGCAARQLAPDRQIAQAGIELIGRDSPEADAEIVLVGAEALAAVGLTRISFDLTLPMLVPSLLDEAGIAGARPRRAGARAGPQGRRGGRAPWRQPGAGADRIAAGRRAGRPGAGGAAAARRCRRPARALAHRLAEAVAAIRARAPSLRLTIDPVEFRGFRYETGVSVTIYAPGRHEELGRGGRYICGEAEPATGLTLFPDAILRAAPPREARQRLFVPLGAGPGRGGRGCAGWAMPPSPALEPDGDPSAEARAAAAARISCATAAAVSRLTRKTEAMANVAVIGAQWGDEGKGKVVDWLASRADIVVRFQGGHNAGHTLVVGNETYKLSLLPSGLVRGKLGIIGNGVVVDPEALLAEIDRVRAQGLTVTPETLRIAENATLILPLHPALDRAREAARGDRKIGTTGRGIGPAYEDKVARRAIRVADLAEPETLARQAGRTAAAPQHAAARPWCRDLFQGGRCWHGCWRWRRKSCRLPNRCGSGWTRRGGPGKRILFEGAQAVMLDVDHGTYPFVTSTNTVAATAASGAGVGPAAVGFVLGIAKAYSTRVGSGPFPTELTRRDRAAAGRPRPRVRHQHRPAAALRLVRRGAGAPGGEGRRHPGPGADQAGRAGRAAGAEDLHRLPDQRRALPASAGGAWRAGRGRTGIRDDGGLVGLHRAAPGPGRICRRRRSNMCGGSRNWWKRRSRCCPPARSGTTRSW